jgi:hypothetical protein
MMGVVKADAYGHGAVPVAKAIEDLVEVYGVSMPEEGVELRKAGLTKPIVILGYTAPEMAELVQSVIGTFGFTETGLPYPLSAKYHMNLCGIPTENISRVRRGEELTPYVKTCMAQMKTATDYFENLLKEQTE